MGYVIAIVGAALALMYGGLQISKANAARWQTRATTAESANVALAKSISGVRAQCAATQKAIDDQAKDDAAKRAKAKAALADRDAKAKASAPKIASLEAILADTTTTTPEADCAAVHQILDDYARDARAADGLPVSPASPVKR